MPRTRGYHDARRARLRSLIGRTDGIWEIDVDTASLRGVVATLWGKGLAYVSPLGRAAPPRACIYLPTGTRKRNIPDGGTWVDHIVGFVDDGKTLVLRRGPFSCAGESEHYVHVSNYRDPTKAHAHVARPIHGIAAVGKTLFMIAGGGLWKIEDRGGHWFLVEPRGLPIGLGSAWQLDASPGGPLLAVVGAGALYASPDAGVNWKRVPTPADVERKENAPPVGIDPQASRGSRRPVTRSSSARG